MSYKPTKLRNKTKDYISPHIHVCTDCGVIYRILVRSKLQVATNIISDIFSRKLFLFYWWESRNLRTHENVLYLSNHKHIPLYYPFKLEYSVFVKTSILLLINFIRWSWIEYIHHRRKLNSIQYITIPCDFVKQRIEN